MKINIKTKNLDLTDPLRVYIDDKVGSLQRFLKRYEEDRNVIVDVEVSRPSNHHHKGEVFYAEINLELPGTLLRASAEDYDARLAINKVRDKMHREIVDYKEKHERG